MSIEEAIKKMTFLPASIFGIHDRGLIRRGMAADLFVFDPEKIDLAEPEKVADLPEGAPRYIQRAKGIHYTIVNGSVLMKNGAHTGVYPGKVLRSSRRKSPASLERRGTWRDSAQPEDLLPYLFVLGIILNVVFADRINLRGARLFDRFNIGVRGQPAALSINLLTFFAGGPARK